MTTETTTEPRSYAIEVIADSSGEYCGNSLRFKTEGAAEEYAKDLAYRWTDVRTWRVIASTNEPNR